MPRLLLPGPAGERPRERLSQHGPGALTTVDLLAILLGTGQAGRTVQSVAQAVHDVADGSLRKLARHPEAELRRIGGVGAAKAARLLAALELGRRLAHERRPSRCLMAAPEDVVRLLADRVRDLDVEEFRVLALSGRRELLREVLVSRGVLNGALVHPREVFRPAIVEAAAGIIVVHNHPSGDPTPSPEDLAITRQLAGCGQLLGIPLLDHLIVGADRWVSLKAQGAL